MWERKGGAAWIPPHAQFPTAQACSGPTAAAPDTETDAANDKVGNDYKRRNGKLYLPEVERDLGPCAAERRVAEPKDAHKAQE